METYSEEAEQACALIMTELSKYRMVEAALLTSFVGRLTSRQQRELSVGYSAITAMIAIVEEFAVQSIRVRLDDCFDDDVAVSSAARSALLRQVEQSWDKRRKALGQWFEGSLSPDPLADTMAFVEARNAIAHGLGSLTPRQLAGDDGRSIRLKLGAVGVNESAGRLSIPESAVARCAVSGRTLMIEWDQIARAGALSVAS